MRKQVVGASRTGAPGINGQGWLDLETVASVELTSENSAFPIEDALLDHHGAQRARRGWSAGEVGAQTITLRFDEPQKITRVRLRFIEDENERSQEFVLRRAVGNDVREIVRQQWVFSPGGSIEELEEYTVDLDGVTMLELTIDPDCGRNRVRATLAELRIG